MKAQETSPEDQAIQIAFDSKNQLPKTIRQFGEAVEVKEEKKEPIDLTMPILNSTIQTRNPLW